MNIIINQSKYVEKFICLTNCLMRVQGLKVNVINGQLKDEIIHYLKPDLVIHDDENQVGFLKNQKVLNILCGNGVVSDLSIDLNKIGPCIDISLFDNIKVENKYKCDVVVFGDITNFDNELLEYANGNYSFRLFGQTPTNLPFYCGMIPRQNYPSAYRSAIVAPFSMKEDRSRLFEIVKSGAIAVVYDPNDPLTFHEEMKYFIQSVRENKAVTYNPPVSTPELESAFNNVKMSEILNGLGFSRLSLAVLKGVI